MPFEILKENKLFVLFNAVNVNLKLENEDTIQGIFFNENTALTTSTLHKIQARNDCIYKYSFL